MVKHEAQPEHGELPLYGLSINVTLTFGSDAPDSRECLEKELADSAIYRVLKSKLVELADTHLGTLFTNTPWRSCSISAPGLMWDNDEYEFKPVELTPLLLLGIDFDMRMQETDYDSLVRMIESETFCNGAETITANCIRQQLISIGLDTGVTIDAEVMGFGSG